LNQKSSAKIIIPVSSLLAQVSFKKVFDKAKWMKISCVCWRLMKIHLKIVFLVY